MSIIMVHRDLPVSAHMTLKNVVTKMKMFSNAPAIYSTDALSVTIIMKEYLGGVLLLTNRILHISEADQINHCRRAEHSSIYLFSNKQWVFGGKNKTNKNGNFKELQTTITKQGA